MHLLYILKSLAFNWHYIGITGDIDNRLAEHNRGEVKSTKSRKPYNIIYVEKFSSKTEARKREIYLKRNSRARRELFTVITLSSSSLV